MAMPPCSFDRPCQVPWVPVVARKGIEWALAYWMVRETSRSEAGMTMTAYDGELVRVLRDQREVYWGKEGEEGRMTRADGESRLVRSCWMVGGMKTTGERREEVL